MPKTLAQIFADNKESILLNTQETEEQFNERVMKEVEAGTAYNLNGQALNATWQISDNDIRIVDSENDEICRISRKDFAKIIAAL